MQEQALDWEQTGCNATVVFGPEGTDCLLFSSPFLAGKLVEYNYRCSTTTRVLSMQHQPTALSISSGGIMVAFADAAGSVGLMQYKTGQAVMLKGRTMLLAYHLLCFVVCADVNGTVWCSEGQCMLCPGIFLARRSSYQLPGAWLCSE